MSITISIIPTIAAFPQFVTSACASVNVQHAAVVADFPPTVAQSIPTVTRTHFTCVTLRTGRFVRQDMLWGLEGHEWKKDGKITQSRKKDI